MLYNENGDNMSDLGYNRNRDVQNIFNDQYKANNNYKQISEQIDRQRAFQNRMYGGVENNMSINDNYYVPTSADRLNEMNQNMNNNREVHNIERMNNLLNKFGNR